MQTVEPVRQSFFFSLFFVDLILKYFPKLSDIQRLQFAALKPLYEEWNAKINIISRKDMDAFYEHHVLHSLSVARIVEFRPMSEILDVGTGGGFPGIPLAIMFPEAHFTLVDSIGKKIRVVEAVVQTLGLSNVRAIQCRAEQLQEEFDFVVSRAVTALPELVQWVKGNISKSQYHHLHNGLLCLKGGDLKEELKTFGNKPKIYEINQYFREPFFETKKVVYLPL